MNAPQNVAKQSGTVNIRGREYQTVAFRVQQFREAHPLWALTTSVLFRDDECVVMQASIGDENGHVLATGHAEEHRKASQINRTSALENAETSAIGRALAALGFGGTEFATANEVQNAVHQQGNPQTGETEARIPTHEPAAREKLEGPHTSKTALKSAVAKIVRAVEACGSLEAIETVKADNKRTINQARRDWPELIDGDPNCPEDIGLKGTIEKRRNELKPESLTLQMLLSLVKESEGYSDLQAIIEEHEAALDELDDLERRRFEDAYNSKEAALVRPTPLVAEHLGG